jgi:hypothetical protein
MVGVDLCYIFSGGSGNKRAPFTHPTSLRSSALSSASGKEGSLLKKTNPLSDEVEERVVKRSVDRVSKRGAYNRPSTRAIGSTNFVAAGFNPRYNATNLSSAVGTTHIIWAEPTALNNVLYFLPWVETCGYNIGRG